MGPIRDVTQAAQALEACLLRQLIGSSGVFKGNGTSGSQIHAQMFVEALADAVEQGGGIGLARLVEDSLSANTEISADSDSLQSTTSALNSFQDRADLPVRHSLQEKGDKP